LSIRYSGDRGRRSSQSASTREAISFGSLLRENPAPTEAEVRSGLEGNLCRCTGYHNIVRAVLAAAGAGEAR